MRAERCASELIFGIAETYVARRPWRDRYAATHEFSLERFVGHISQRAACIKTEQILVIFRRVCALQIRRGHLHDRVA
jgi:hypothetical protein